MRKKVTEKEKKARQEALKNESKAVKFKRVCTPRLRAALKAMALIGNCSTKDYAYSQEQVEKIFKSLDGAIETLIKQFSGTAAESTAIEL